MGGRTESEMQRQYREAIEQERSEELIKKGDIIQSFIDFCKGKDILLTKDNFDYIPTIGVIATTVDSGPD